MEAPSIGMRLCVGDRAIPTETKTPYDNEGRDVKTDFVLLTSRDKSLKWLEEPLGHYARSFKFEPETSLLATDFWKHLKWKRHGRFRRPASHGLVKALLRKLC